MTAEYNTEQTIREVSEMNFSGNILPNSWFDKILLENGKLDVNAVLILSEIVYWYRPRTVRNELTGDVIGHEKKFAADMLQMSVSAFANKFHLTVRQVRDAINRLEKNGFIIKVRKTFKISSFNCPNVLFLAPVVSKLKSMEKELPIVERPVNEDELLKNIEYVDHRTSDAKTSQVTKVESVQKPHEIKDSDFTDIDDQISCDDQTLQVATAYENSCDERMLYERRYNVTPPTVKRHSYIKNTKTTTENTQRLAAAEKENPLSHTGIPPQSSRPSFAAAPILKKEEDKTISEDLTDAQKLYVSQVIFDLRQEGELSGANQKTQEVQFSRILLNPMKFKQISKDGVFLQKVRAMVNAIKSGMLDLTEEVQTLPLRKGEREIQDELIRLKNERHSQKMGLEQAKKYGLNTVSGFTEAITELTEKILRLERKNMEGALS